VRTVVVDEIHALTLTLLRAAQPEAAGRERASLSAPGATRYILRR
jgi:hypothetical protein